MNYDELGELIGHISIGLELVNALWQKTKRRKCGGVENSPAGFGRCSPASFALDRRAPWREQEFGSPVAPKTPEAMALHYIDNLDARLEMFAAGYTTPNRWPRAFLIACGRCRGTW